MRLRGDVAADSLISEVFADDVQKTAFRNLLDFINVNTDLQQVTNFYAVKEAFRSAKKLPAWADQKLMDQGAKFFAVHAGTIMNFTWPAFFAVLLRRGGWCTRA